MTTRKLYVGPPHFKNLKKQIISGLNTTIYQSFKDILDYSVENSNIINIDIKYTDDAKTEIDYIKIKDNTKEGFINIEKEGSENPLNFACININHTKDNSESTFGSGLKTALVGICNVAEIISKVVNEDT